MQFWKIVLQLCPPSFKTCVPVLHGLLKAEKVLVLERPQASATSRVLCVDWRTPKSALFEEFEWLALGLRREVFCRGMAVFYRLLQNCQPPPSEFPSSFSKDRNAHATRKLLDVLLPSPTFAK